MRRGTHTILVGDVRRRLADMPENHFHVTCTSPPYWSLRDYGVEGQIGSEKTPEEYLATMVEVFRGVRRTLREDGVLFVNLGDSYAQDKKWGGKTGGKHAKGLHGSTGIGRQRTNTGLKEGDIVNIPHRFAAALQADGWYWRDTIIWWKPAPMPSSQQGVRWARCRVKVEGAWGVDRPHPDNTTGVLRDRTNVAAKWAPCPGCEKCIPNDGYVLRRGRFRTTCSHEYIFMFSKGKHYFCDAEAAKEPVSGGAHHRGSGVNPKTNGAVAGREKQNPSFSAAVKDLVEQRIPRSFWKIAPESYGGKHFAAFPSELPKRCIDMATSAVGCCPTCGEAWAPVVETLRKATRPGNETKVGRVGIHEESPYHDHAGIICGNRDPKRHTTITKVTGHRPTCDCGGDPVPCRVLDPFLGTGTTAQVATWYGRDATGIELNPEYAAQAEERIAQPPKCLTRSQKKRKTQKPAHRGRVQGSLFDNP